MYTCVSKSASKSASKFTSPNLPRCVYQTDSLSPLPIYLCVYIPLLFPPMYAYRKDPGDPSSFLGRSSVRWIDLKFRGRERVEGKGKEKDKEKEKEKEK